MRLVSCMKCDAIAAQCIGARGGVKKYHCTSCNATYLLDVEDDDSSVAPSQELRHERRALATLALEHRQKLNTHYQNVMSIAKRNNVCGEPDWPATRAGGAPRKGELPDVDRS